jgi:hypothetical protein
MLSQKEITSRFRQNLYNDKSSLISPEQNDQLADLCAITLKNFDTNIMADEQFDAGITFAYAVREFFMFGKQIEELKQIIEKTPSFPHDSARNAKTVNGRNGLEFLKCMIVMANYSQAITEQLMVPGDKSDHSLEQGLTYVATVQRILEIS